jgi:hypothetical protein
MAGRDESDSLGILERDGFYVTCGYMPIVDKLQFVLRYDVYDPDSAIEENRVKRYVLTGTWFFNQNANIRLEYIIEDEEGAEVDNNLFAIQFQTAF